jgi:hypothetical protein
VLQLDSMCSMQGSWDGLTGLYRSCPHVMLQSCQPLTCVLLAQVLSARTQQQRVGLGHHMGPCHLPGPGPLAPSPHRAGAQPAHARHGRLLFGVRSSRLRWRAHHTVHGRGAQAC